MKDVLIRALKTFWQAALAYAIPALSGVDFFRWGQTENSCRHWSVGVGGRTIRGI